MGKNITASPQSAFADIIKAYFGSKPVTDARKDDNHHSPTPAPDFRQAIESATDDQALQKAARIISEAKSDRVASKVVVNQAQDELKKAREEAERIRKEAGEAVNRAREEAALSRREADEAINEANGWMDQVKTEIINEKKQPVLSPARRSSRL